MIAAGAEHNDRHGAKWRESPGEAAGRMAEKIGSFRRGGKKTGGEFRACVCVMGALLKRAIHHSACCHHSAFLYRVLLPPEKGSI